MKKLLRYGIIGFCIYVACMLYFGNTNKYFSYNEIDDNHDGFLSPGELLWYSDVGTQVKCDSATNNSSRKCVLVIFALKDGLTIKEIPIDDNQTNIGKYDKLEDTPYQQGLQK